MIEAKVVKVLVPKSGSYEIGDTIQTYTDACKKAFESVRKLKKLGIGQPWIDIHATGQDPEDIIYECRIRLEVR